MTVTEAQAYGERAPDAKIVAVSESMRATFDLCERVAASDISVLISGESGTGKEVVARHIHQASTRASGPFVAINCAAIPESMLEAILFGHVKGAFTGASDKRIGKFELAHGGTLLLDEITEMPIGLQAKLLRVLQEKEIERIGSNTTVSVDVRVLATSNRDLVTAVRDGALREDLYYRLSVFPLRLPSLRERPADVLPLAETFIDKYANEPRPTLSTEARAALTRHAWPGNVRELENCIQRALVLCPGDLITGAHLALETTSIESIDVLQSTDHVSASDSLQACMQSAEDELLLRTLEENRGVRKTTAHQLGIAERTLRHKLAQLKARGVLPSETT